ncbi:MAG: sulfatase-like hydrolase/transferase [Planctomycetales bacterium]
MKSITHSGRGWPLSFVCVAALGGLPGANAFAAAPQKPNIVLILADDIGVECFGCYGSRQYRTPNIDRLAERGMRFRHCYSQPLCTPSRVELMTGLSNARNYSAFSVLNSDQKTFAHHLKDSGFATAVAGKWQLFGAEQYDDRFRGKGTWPKEAGFDRCCLWQVDRLGSRYWNPLLYVDGENRQHGGGEYGPHIAANYLLEFMAEHRDRPFCAYYPMILPHGPFEPTPDSESRQSADKQRNFEDMVAYMDKLVGRIVAKTDELGIAERTLILFAGDNGTGRTITSSLDGRTIQGGKGLTTDAGTHVPLVACFPGTVPAGRVSDDLVSFTDFLPTLLETAGAAVPDGLDGRSFLPQLRGEKGNPREAIHCFYCPRPERDDKPVRFARDQRWKLYGNGRFFDVRDDPLEKKPLADLPDDSPASAARRKLAAELERMPSEGAMLLKFAR